MQTCEVCGGSGWRIAIERGAVHVYRYGIWCVRCRGLGEVPETDEERERWRRRVYREDIAPHVNRSVAEEDTGE